MNARTKNLIGTLVLAGMFAAGTILPTACVPDAQAEAEAVAADVQDAQTAAMQEAIDRVCGHLDVRTQLACAVDVLSELQPDRWTPEYVERAHEAVETIELED